MFFFIFILDPVSLCAQTFVQFSPPKFAWFQPNTTTGVIEHPAQVPSKYM